MFTLVVAPCIAPVVGLSRCPREYNSGPNSFPSCRKVCPLIGCCPDARLL